MTIKPDNTQTEVSNLKFAIAVVVIMGLCVHGGISDEMVLLYSMLLGFAFILWLIRRIRTREKVETDTPVSKVRFKMNASDKRILALAVLSILIPVVLYYVRILL